MDHSHSKSAFSLVEKFILFTKRYVHLYMYILHVHVHVYVYIYSTFVHVHTCICIECMHDIIKQDPLYLQHVQYKVHTA